MTGRLGAAVGDQATGAVDAGPGNGGAGGGDCAGGRDGAAGRGGALGAEAGNPAGRADDAIGAAGRGGPVRA
ncbi:MAG: S1 family peptidase, partial [Gemmatimonadales bacterium]